MRRALVLVAVAVAGLGAPSVAAAAGTVSVQLTGAGTVDLEVSAGTPARAVSCPPHPQLDRPDTGDPYLACSGAWQPVCTPAAGAATCDVRVRATPRVPGAPDLEDANLSRERANDLKAALAKLPPEQRDVIVMRFVLGLSPGEIAERIGRSEDAVHGLQHRGRTTLRRELTALQSAPAARHVA